MKKVIVTRENYEEVMFSLLENEYPKDVRENILDQIHADTFLAFEWSQWSKATYTESTEKYKEEEAEFIESLTREEDHRKGGIFTIYRPFAMAATMALLIGLALVFLNTRENRQATFAKNGTIEEPELKIVQEKSENPSLIAENTVHNTSKLNSKDYGKMQTKDEVQTYVNTLPAADSIKAFVVEEDYWEIKMQDTIREMIAKAISKPRSRYQVSIVEGKMDNTLESPYVYAEKRYTMADVLVKKDGITLSKFLDNSNSKIIKKNNTTYIEYIAADMSVLVLTLSN